MKIITVFSFALALLLLSFTLSTPRVSAQTQPGLPMGTGEAMPSDSAETVEAPAVEPQVIPEAIRGRWLVGEISDNPEAILDISASNAIGIPFRRDSPPVQLVLDPGSSPPHYRFLALEQGNRRTYDFHLVSDDLALAWDDSDTNPDLVVARRLGPIPNELLGEWVLVSPGERQEARILFETQTYLLEIGDRSRPGRAEGAGSAEVGFYVFMDFGDGQPRLIHYVPLAEGVMLAHPYADEEFLVFHRPGSRPAWAEPFLRPVAPPAVGPVGPTGP